MSLTPEVSKLSGWLKAVAYCRVQRGHTRQSGNAWHDGDVAHRGKVESTAARAACACGSARVCGQKAQAEAAHKEHVAHACDAGGVKAQRLVESIRILPSPKGAPNMSEGNAWRGAEMRHRGEGRITQRTQRVCVTQPGCVVRRRRRKRTWNMRFMSVTPEVSKLSGWLKAVADCGVQKRSTQHREARGTEMWHTEGGDTQRTQRVRVAQLGCVGRRRNRKRT